MGARLDRDRDSLLVFFVCIILFCVATAVNSLADLLMAAARAQLAEVDPDEPPPPPSRL